MQRIWTILIVICAVVAGIYLLLKSIDSTLSMIMNNIELNVTFKAVPLRDHDVTRQADEKRESQLVNINRTGLRRDDSGIYREKNKTKAGDDIIYTVYEVVNTTFVGVPVNVYIPSGEGRLRPGIVLLHGGGWISYNRPMYALMATLLTEKLGAVVVVVDYRLAPKFTYPGPLEDCFVTTAYFLQRASDFGVDSHRVAIYGDSAGGNLAAAVALKLRDTNVSLKLKLQVLIYPALQAFDLNTPSYQQNAHINTQHSKSAMASRWLMYSEGHLRHLDDLLNNEHTSRDDKQLIFTTYLNPKHLPKDYLTDKYIRNKSDFGNEHLWKKLKPVFMDPYFAPLLADDLSRLPPSYILTCGRDVFRDDGAWYAQRLRHNKVDVTYVNYKTERHGAVSRSLKSGSVHFKDIVKYLKENL